MKSIIVCLLLALLLGSKAQAQFVTIPDANFVTFLQTNYPACMSGNQMDTTCTAITSLQTLNVSNKSIADLTGVQYFNSLIFLYADNNLLTSLPPLPPSIIHLRFAINQITSVSSFPPNLLVLVCSNNPNLSTFPNFPSTLESLYMGGDSSLVLPPLPSGLKVIDVQHCDMSTLPALPSGVTTLICANNPIGVLPSLPPTLETLEAASINMTVFPTLPPTLTHLGVSNNNLSALPAVLPAGLTTIYCSHNQLTVLPPLPATLSRLDCDDNMLAVLPTMPSTMTFLQCQFNQLTSLPALPTGLQYLVANDNQITSVSNLPATCYSVVLDNNQISCFGPFPVAPQMNVSATNNPFTCLPNYPAYMTPQIGTIPICTTGNAMGCAVGEGIGGMVFDDLNADCIRNGVDIGVKNVPVKVYDNLGTFVQGGSSHDGGAYFYTQGLGTWTVGIDTTGKPYRVTCAYPGLDTSVTLGVGTELAQGVNFEVDCKPGFDVGANAVGIQGLLFPGQPFASRIYAGDLSNFFGMNCGAGVTGQVTVTYSGPATYTGPMAGALTPMVAGNTFTYNIADFGTVNSLLDFGLEFSMLTTATVTDTICFSVMVTPTSGDRDPANNSYQICTPVRNSYDPNSKEVSPATVAPYYDGWLNYTVHFQNLGNAPAFNIRVEDTLDSNLDWESLEMIDASHYQTWNLLGNALAVYFPNIMLADSASDPAGSQGWFMYRIKPKANLPLNTVIPNSAAIYFDFNAPVITNIATTSYNLVTGVRDQVNAAALISVYPNPSAAVFNVEFPTTWKKADWTVTNLIGQELMHGTVAGGAFAIDLSAHAAGFYLLRMSDGRQASVRQIVKR